MLDSRVPVSGRGIATIELGTQSLIGRERQVRKGVAMLSKGSP